MQEHIAELRDITVKIDALNSRKEEIKAKARRHRSEVTLESATADTAEIEGIKTEIAALEARAITIRKENPITENRKEFIDMSNNIENIKDVNIRTAFAKHVLFNSTKRADAKLTDIELRALGVAVTTTSETFIAPSADADGVNNGGIFIPQEIMLDILREEELESPIYRDILTTAIKGKIKFPYRAQMTPAKTKAELEPTENKSVEWKILNAATGNYTDSIVLTFEEEAMAIDEFASYLVSLIGESMRELLINDYIYGTGADDHVYGLTYTAVDAGYAAADATNYRKILEAGIKKLPVKKRAGAKIYLASDIFDGMTFEKNSNGDYLLPVLNGGGFTKMSTFPVEMDVNLKAGDFVIGNLGKWYKANINKNMELGLDVSNQKRIKTYTTHMMVSAAPVPNSIVYGKKNA